LTYEKLDEERNIASVGNIIFNSRVLAMDDLFDMDDFDKTELPVFLGLSGGVDYDILPPAWNEPQLSSSSDGASQQSAFDPTLSHSQDETTNAPNLLQSGVLVAPTEGAATRATSSTISPTSSASSTAPTSPAASVVAVAADASPIGSSRPTTPELLATPDVQMIEIECPKHPKSIKDLSFGVRWCKIFYNHGKWAIKGRCSKGFAVDASVQDDGGFKKGYEGNGF
jgi:hypothetical protein